MNFFSVLESDDEEEKPQVQNASKAAKAPKAKPATAAAPVEVLPPSQVTGGRGGGGRGGRGAGGRTTHKSAPKQTNEDAPPPRKREFDRRSGTGRGKEVSKGGSGGRNWGSAKEDALHAEKNEDNVEDVEVGVAEGEVVEAEPAAPEPETFTLDEFMAKRNAGRTGAAFGAVNERAAVADFSGLKPKEEQESTFIALGSSKEQKSKGAQRSDGKTVIVDLGLKFEKLDARGGDRENSGRGRGNARGRGGRDNGRNNGGRGGGKGRGSNGAKIDINDSSAFPSL